MNRSLVLRLSALFQVLLAALLSFGVPAPACADPAMGTMAPAFRLQDQHEAWVSLADQKGKWVVVYFYPLDDSPGCTTEACDFRDNIFAFRKLGVNVLGISVQDVASKKEFATKYSLPFSVLADTDKSVAKAYGVLSIIGFARRDTFVIDPQGRIARHYIGVDPKTHSAQLLVDLKALVKPAG
ncbi:MAG TPA: peroxiredoxin [Steroidobacteraceae bacterium]|jgi:thioredoxin-dependent peroxiredoxin|nr:peroxiredoxin [Steroidobacteraceae bacterium]